MPKYRAFLNGTPKCSLAPGILSPLLLSCCSARVPITTAINLIFFAITPTPIQELDETQESEGGGGIRRVRGLRY